MNVNYRRVTGLFGGAAAGALAVGAAELAQAQDDSGGTISIGGSLDGLGESISSTVTGAVSGVATSDDSDVSGGSSGSGTIIDDDDDSPDQEAVAIADASGGDNNVSFVS